MKKIDAATGNSFWNYASFARSNTVVAQDINTMKVFLHGHAIVTLNGAGQLTLDKCGWQTVTTKTRMNAVLKRIGATVYQEKFAWYIWDRRNQKTYEFFDDKIILQLSEGNRRIEKVRYHHPTLK